LDQLTNALEVDDIDMSWLLWEENQVVNDAGVKSAGLCLRLINEAARLKLVQVIRNARS
jgi:hypothetical protein